MALKCSIVGCAIDDDYLISTIRKNSILIALCPNHALMYTYNNEMDMIIYDLDNNKIKTEVICELDGSTDNTFIYTTDNNGEKLSIAMNKKHIINLIRRNLEPDQYFLLLKKYGIFFEIHSDFYDEDGIKLQPKY
jgi:hypothetical protein